ncbi:sulfur transport family protein [Bordetella holmesii 70147]|uniref:Sulfur transport family protein n=1 Tax=Bordetella holmesii 1058 TaxID=1247648 RepID=A0ABN0S2B4_9BORD|nr:sulfur transport family protein [Bordetella holmesii 44057]EWM50622.1 sulfur transport family protein [Bordetella holmesii 70147]EXX95706.1 sulfur transport family protein [Bordetella holmesii 1058]
MSGAVIFGLGWELAGLSPVTAVLTASQGYDEALTFGLAMVVGMGAFSFWQKPTSERHR